MTLSGTSSPHILSGFELRLMEFRKNALMMGSLTQRSIARAWKGVMERDEGACNTVIADDEEIDILEVQIDQEGIALLLKFQPLASDLRHVIATMKFSANLERISDQAVGIARRARKLNLKARITEAAELEPMFLHADSMVRDAIKAYADQDAELARTLKGRDRELDTLNREFANKLTELMQKNPVQIEEYLELIFIARFLERIGDQATSISEDTVFAVDAEDIRHLPAGSGSPAA
ncbi:MAG: phosphate transport system regulatory protein PhoU [Verrucomicrobiaceae bacterium]|nr:MAG: phosphate transport system regulatory protein PhoU [Verrucomicrobiaceae bacterium]